MRDCGVSPMAALVSANSVGAQALGMTAVRRVVFVMKGGMVYKVGNFISLSSPVACNGLRCAAGYTSCYFETGMFRHIGIASAVFLTHLENSPHNALQKACNCRAPNNLKICVTKHKNHRMRQEASSLRKNSDWLEFPRENSMGTETAPPRKLRACH